MVEGTPDFVGVGVQKAGTTWWYQLLCGHPSVHHPVGRDKELHHFDGGWAGVDGLADEYSRLFPRPEGTITGEWTPRYLHDFWVVPQLAAAAPAARILVMLRDPIERFRSGVAHELRSRGRRDPAIPGDALRRGLYGEQLEHLLRHYDRSQVLVIQYEKAVADTPDELARTWRFLGLEPVELPAGVDPGRLVNATTAAKPELDSGLEAELRRRYAADAALLEEICPELDLELWSSGADLLASPFL